METKEIERALITRYRNKLYRPFIKALKHYEMLKENDVIGVCISGGKDSLTLAKLFQELSRFSDFPITVKYLVMNPGFNEENLTQLKLNAKSLGIPIIIKDSDVFKVAYNHGGNNPCYLCARMRRGFLYEFAKEQGCNKIALGHHFNDVIETTMLNVLYAGCYKTMLPKLQSQNFPGMELIRPMVFIFEKDIVNFMKYIGIEAMSCGCKIASGQLDSKRKEIKALIAEMKLKNKEVEKNIYRSSENVHVDTVLGWKKSGKRHHFLDEYEQIKDDNSE
ncbi:MAG: ATP-binding protein [Bacilli bacterium]